MLLAVSVHRDALYVLHREPGQSIRSDPAVEQPGDVGMIQRGEDLPLLQEPLDSAVVPGAPGRQHLEGDALLVLVVGALGKIDGTHAAAPELAEDAVRTEPRPCIGEVGEGGRVVEEGCGQRRRRDVEHGSRLGTLEERRHLGPEHRVVDAALFDERRPLRGLELQGTVRGIEHAPPPRSGNRSTHRRARCSQPLALVQSRRTVRAVTPNASAVSSSVNPPKKRHSTTRLSRSSTTDSSVNASSRAINVSARSSIATGKSVRLTRLGAAPRFRAPRRRAWSTRIRRMARAATAKKWPRSVHWTRVWSTSLRYASWTKAVVPRVRSGCSPLSCRCAMPRSASYTRGKRRSRASRSPARHARSSPVMSCSPFIPAVRFRSSLALQRVDGLR